MVDNGNGMWLDNDMNTTTAADIRTTPHRYQGHANSTWRTCVHCGQGANATIHKAAK